MKLDLKTLPGNTVEAVLAYINFFLEISEGQFHQNLFHAVKREAQKLADGKGRGIIELPTPTSRELVFIYKSFFGLSIYCQHFLTNRDTWVADFFKSPDGNKLPWVAAAATPEAMCAFSERFTPAMFAFKTFSDAVCKSLLGSADWKTRRILTENFRPEQIN